MLRCIRSLSLLLIVISLTLMQGISIGFAQSSHADQKAREYINAAYAYYENGQYKEAVTACDSAIKIAPDNPLFYSSKAIFLMKLGKLEEAIRCYQEVIVRAPRSVYAYQKKASLQLELKKPKDALKTLDQGLKSNPKALSLLEMKGAALFSRRDDKNAAACFHKIIQLDPNWALPYYQLSLIYSAQKNKTLTLKHLKKSIQLDLSMKSAAIADINFRHLQNSKDFKLLTSEHGVIDGNILFTRELPLFSKNSLYLPIKDLSPAVGIQFSWHPGLREVVIKKSDRTLKLSMNNQTAYMNGNKIKVSKFPVLKDKMIYFPVELLTQTFGFESHWSGNEKALYSTTVPLKKSAASDQKVLSQLEKQVENIFIDGLLPNPYSLKATEGYILLIAKNKNASSLFHQLSREGKKKFLGNALKSKSQLKGLERITVFWIYQVNKYAQMDFSGGMKALDHSFLYFKQGMPMHTVVQDKASFTFFKK